MALNTVYTLDTGSQVSLALRSPGNTPFTSTHLTCCLHWDSRKQLLHRNRSSSFTVPSSPDLLLLTFSTSVNGDSKWLWPKTGVVLSACVLLHPTSHRSKSSLLHLQNDSRIWPLLATSTAATLACLPASLIVSPVRLLITGIDLARAFPVLHLGSLLYKGRNMNGPNFKAPYSSDMRWFALLGGSIHFPSSPV